MSNASQKSKSTTSPTVDQILTTLEALRPYSDHFTVVLGIRGKGWFKDYIEELDIETIKVDPSGDEVNMYFDCDNPFAPIPHQSKDNVRISMILKSFLWKLDALPDSASELPLEARTLMGEDAHLDRTITRIRSVLEPPKVIIEICSHEVTWTGWDRSMVWLRAKFRQCVDALSGQQN